MKRTVFSSARWRKSSRSGGASGQCVEVVVASGLVGVRDSKNPGGAYLVLDRTVFYDVLGRVKAGEFDL